MIYSAAFYPELWSRDVIEQDIEEMKRVGLNAVRIGEFAWANMEPREGEIDLSFFRKVIEKLYENGISTILCTPTPTPPVWMSDGHPNRMHVSTDGTVMHHGSRQHVCTNGAHMRKCSDRIVKAMAKELGSLPGVIAWQLDNEFKCHVHECVCENCVELWHEWLREKYGKIDRLNEAWGAQIWSEQYLDFDQVPPPVATPFLYNTSLALNYLEFTHDKIAEFAARQAEIIRKYSAAPITHNACPQFGFDHETMFAPLDFVAYDMYPSAAMYETAACDFDLYRALGKGRYWLMETSTSYNGCIVGSQPAHPKGFLEAELFAAAASGAEAVSFWLWRQQRAGCEQPHGSLLSSWGAPTVGYEPAKRAGKLLQCIAPLTKSTRVSRSPLAVSYSDTARFFFETEPFGVPSYFETMSALRARLARLSQTVDFVWPSGDLEGCRVLVTPYLPHIPDELIERADAFMRAGGVWVVGPMSGHRTAECTVPTDHALHCFEERYGFTTKYIYPIHDSGASVAAFGEKAEAGQYACVFDEKDVAVLGRYEGGCCDGEAAVIELPVGAGKLIVVGAADVGAGAGAVEAAIWRHAMDEAGVEFPFRATPGTSVWLRESDSARYLFAVNLDGKGGEVTLADDDWQGVCGEKPEGGSLRLAAFETAVFVQL